MALRDTLKGLTQKAREQAAEHKDDLKKAIDKAEDVADKKTQGKYHDKIKKAGDKAGEYVEKLQPEEAKDQGHTEKGAGADAK